MGEGIPSGAVGVSGDVEQTSKPRGETVTLMHNDSNLGILFHCNHPYITWGYFGHNSVPLPIFFYVARGRKRGFSQAALTDERFARQARVSPHTW